MAGNVHEQNATTGKWGVRSSTQTSDSGGNPAGNMIISDPTPEGMNALPAVVPTVSSVATPEISLASTAVIVFGRFTVNSGDDNTAAERLTNGHPDCAIVITAETVNIQSSYPITRIDFVAVGDASNGDVVAHDESVQATIASALTKFEFNSLDQVHSVDLTLSDTWNSGVEAQLRIEGRSYA